MTKAELGKYAEAVGEETDAVSDWEFARYREHS